MRFFYLIHIGIFIVNIEFRFPDQLRKLNTHVTILAVQIPI